MSFLDQIDRTLLSYNRPSNISRTLEALRYFPQVIVVDSGSTDGTADIVVGFPNTRLVTRAFDNHASQWTYGLTECGLGRPWVLALDADYLVPLALIEEMSRLTPSDAVAGYKTSFRYCIKGAPLSTTLYTPAVTLYRRERARYVQAGHTQRVVVEGDVIELQAKIDHDDRKPLARWLSSQQRYAKLEAEHLLQAPPDTLRPTDRVRLTGWAGPPLVFFYSLFWKRCIFDGGPGEFIRAAEDPGRDDDCA